MKCGRGLQRTLTLTCVVLANLRLAWSRPSDKAQTTYPPPLNCSTNTQWTPASEPSDARQHERVEGPDRNYFKNLYPGDEAAEDQEGDLSSPLSSSSSSEWTNEASFNRSLSVLPGPSPHYPNYTNQDNDYFDYYYEADDEMEASQDAADYPSEGQSAEGYHGYQQPPPGLNRVAKLKLIRTPRRQPPEYMLELYDRFSRAVKRRPTTARPPDDADRGSGQGDPGLGADIVRSFPNINKEESPTTTTTTPGDNADSGTDGDKTAAKDPENQQEQLAGRETRHHTLVFNITSLLAGEQVSRAELRLYTLVAHDRNTYVGDDRVVRVFEGLGGVLHRLPPVAVRHVYGHSGGWEAFDVTPVVQAWVRKGSGTGDGVHVLQVSIDSVFRAGGRGLAPVMDIDVDPEHNEGPLLVIFSRDTSHHLQAELHDLIGHEEGSPAAEAGQEGGEEEEEDGDEDVDDSGEDSDLSDGADFSDDDVFDKGDVSDDDDGNDFDIDSADEDEDVSNYEDVTDEFADSHSREGSEEASDFRKVPQKDKSKTSSEKTGYNAGSDKEIIFERKTDTNGDKDVVHAKTNRHIQKRKDKSNIVKIKSNTDNIKDTVQTKTAKSKRHTNSDKINEARIGSRNRGKSANAKTYANTNRRSRAKNGGQSLATNTALRARRSKRRAEDSASRQRRIRRDKRKRNSCRRKTMYVNFHDINWHQWIIAPSGYMAFECVGKCYVPIGAHLSPTKHAIIQTLVHAAHPKMAERACCVPTKLEPISILYLDENNVITYKYHYDGMVVAECGCR